MNQNQTDSISLQENGCLGGKCKQIKASKKCMWVLTKPQCSEEKLEICLLSFNQGWVSKKWHRGVRMTNIPSTPGTELKEFHCILIVTYRTGRCLLPLHRWDHETPGAWVAFSRSRSSKWPCRTPPPAAWGPAIPSASMTCWSDKAVLEHTTSAMRHLVKANHTCAGLDGWPWRTQMERGESYLDLTRVTWYSCHGSKWLNFMAGLY